ncbi:MAG: S26 family signal peptidase [Candidatus Thermoplasmatota archaeon]|nr:S26 family signal peptidase [Candidatus Thermoplasmatota archaeon]
MKLKKSAILGFVKDLLVASIIILIILTAMYAYTGVWPPIVVIESNSMEHSGAPYGRLGTIDAGDFTFVKKVNGREDIVTYYQGKQRGYTTYGNYGDVIIFLKNGLPGTPLIHRAMVWVELNITYVHLPEEEMLGYGSGQNIDLWYLLRADREPAQQFTPTSDFLISKVRLYIRMESGGGGTINVVIRPDTGNDLPDDAVALTSIATNSSASASGVWLDFVFSERVLLKAGVKYWIHAACNDSVGYAWATKSADAYITGIFARKEAESWVKYPTYDTFFYVYGNKTQEKILYDVPELGIFNQSSITIEGLVNNYKPWFKGERHSGFITKGDANDCCDQRSRNGELVKVDWIIGVARGELPWFGGIKLLFDDLTTGSSNAGNVRGDCWAMLVVAIALLLAVPTSIDYSYPFIKNKIVAFREQRKIKKKRFEKLEKLEFEVERGKR